MPAANNIRVLYQNVADSSNVLQASSTAGNLIPANMLTDIKSEIYRSVSTNTTLSIQWPSAQLLNMVALVFTNLTPQAAMRVRAYRTVNDASPILDTGNVAACGYQPLGMWGWGSVPLGVNAFRFGNVSHGRIYFAGVNAQKITVDVIDNTNPKGFLEIARLVTGYYWSPECNPDYNAGFGYKYNSQHMESEAGDIRTERRPRRRTMELNLAWLKIEADQLAMHEIMLGNGMERPLFVSLFPENADPVLEQRCQMYCKLDGDHAMSHPMFGTFAAPLRLLEI